MNMNAELSELVNPNLKLMEDDESRLIYISQVYYLLTGDYSYIGKMLRSLCYDNNCSFASNEIKKAINRNIHDIDNLKPVSYFAVDNGNMFFDPGIVSIHNNEVFCDCGALDMASSLEFVYQAKGNFNKIYAFEPDPLCYEMCCDNLLMFSPGERKRILLYDFGLDEISGTRKFEHSAIPGNSRIDNIGGLTVRVEKLDALSECRDISFFKIHTEGSEPAVIKGASELIKANRPVLAVSLYHNLKELLDVPVFLHTLVPEYRIFMRHYSLGTSESVLYAIQ